MENVVFCIINNIILDFFFLVGNISVFLSL